MSSSEISTEVTVSVERDHLEKVARTRRPIDAIQELIWNSLDADASEVEVVFDRNELDGIEKIRIEDNGTGFTPNFAICTFQRLGGSWKRNALSTAKGRMYHGKEGKGRFTALSLGDTVSWDSISRDEHGHWSSCHIKSQAGSIDRFSIAGSRIQNESGVSKTTVTISGVPESVHGLVGDAALSALLREFALYLFRYPGISIIYDGNALNADDAIVSRTPCEVSAKIEGNLHRAAVDIVEWKSSGPQGVYLCDGEGFPIMEIAKGISPLARQLTTHIQSDSFRELERNAGLTIGNLHPIVRGLLNEARRKIEDHSRKAKIQKTTDRIKSWQEDNVYPFDGPPKNVLETAQQSAFNILASEAEERAPEIQRQGKLAKKLLFRLLRNAVEHGPESTRVIFSQVLELTEEQQQELAVLLGHTSLSAIVSSAKTVTDRLNFLTALEMLVYDFRKNVKERGHLQQLIEANAWMFGEEFSLAGSEVSLDRVLETHASILGKEYETGPVKSARGKKTDIVDLFLARSVPYYQGKEHHFLVVELKRPSRRIDIAVWNQTVGYASAVARDRRFHGRTVKWSFWMMGTEMDETVAGMARRHNAPKGRVAEPFGNVDIWAFTWAELIVGCRSRMSFFQDCLGYSATAKGALDSVKAAYPEFLPPEVLKTSKKTSSKTSKKTSGKTSKKTSKKSHSV